MKASEFCYWLQGYFEIEGQNATLTMEQCEVVRNHLGLVFVHDLDPKQIADKLQAIHDGNEKPQIGGSGPNGEIYRC